MVDSADEARRVAAVAATALRLVNEAAAEALIAAASRGETRARLAVDPVRAPFATGRVGRLYDSGLIEALEGGGEQGLARACRIFIALGFVIATTPDLERDGESGRPADSVSAIRIGHLELDFTTATVKPPAAGSTLLNGVVLPAAHLWRSRAEAARRIDGYQRKALSLIAVEADQGGNSCRLPWSRFASGRPDSKQLQQLGELLRERGFRVEQTDNGASLLVSW